MDKYRNQRRIRRAVKPFFRMLSRDEITKQKIHKNHDIIRIGSEYGGWYIPDNILNKDSICYCAGCGDDISFDLGLIEKYGCTVYGFDPTPESIKYVSEKTKDIAKYHFFETGIWDEESTLKFYPPADPNHISHSLTNLQKTENYIEVNVRSIKNIMIEHGHDKIDLLKLDIEGAEYRVVESLMKEEIYPKILCVEFDEYMNPLDNVYISRIRKTASDIVNSGYKLVFADIKEHTFVRE